jgi:hypothetical protein
VTWEGAHLPAHGVAIKQAGIAECLENLAAVELAGGNAGRAAWLLGAGDELREATGAARPASEVQAYAQCLRTVRDLLGIPAYQSAWHTGRELGAAGVTAAVLDSRSQVTRQPDGGQGRPYGLPAGRAARV